MLCTGCFLPRHMQQEVRQSRWLSDAMPTEACYERVGIQELTESLADSKLPDLLDGWAQPAQPSCSQLGLATSKTVEVLVGCGASVSSQMLSTIC